MRNPSLPVLPFPLVWVDPALGALADGGHAEDAALSDGWLLQAVLKWEY